MFTLGVSGDIAIFTEHNPVEFEAGVHYLVNSITGAEIEPVFELEEESPAKWDLAIGGSIIVLLVTLVGVITFTPCIQALCKSVDPNTNTVVLSAFAAGALISTAFFLILFEPSHMLEPLYENEADAIAVWGTSILCGFMLSPVFEAIFSLLGLQLGHDHAAVSKEPAPIEMQSPGTGSRVAADPAPASATDKDSHWNQQRCRLFVAIMVGDFMHNFVDGVFIAVGFTLCDSTAGWTIVAATVGHEIVQELADFQLLIGDMIGLSKPKALACNFATGTSVVIGAIVGCSVGFSDKAAAIILCMGGGVYLQIAATEAMPRFLSKATTNKNKWLGILPLLSLLLQSVSFSWIMSTAKASMHTEQNLPD